MSDVIKEMAIRTCLTWEENELSPGSYITDTVCGGYWAAVSPDRPTNGFTWRVYAVDKVIARGWSNNLPNAAASAALALDEALGAE